ncbi:MAG TPA: YqgE/AlgH family protein [Thermoleophilaceae bacterium]|nr:YqgE/AlgH family protein [Thermoleophilaceae bacterium]
MSDGLRGQLLIAAPSLQDYFRRTVVLVIEHTPDGAMGVVLNRAADVRVADVVPALADLPDSDQLVRLGGPVAPESLVALGDFERTDEAGTTVLGSLGTLDPEAPNESLRRLRVYAGYAGWGPGQLDGELEQDAWIIVAAKVDDPFEEGDLWSEAVGRKGGSYRLLSTMPSDPSLN